MLFSMREIKAVLALLNRIPMTQAEQLFAQKFFERLVAFCTPPAPEPEEPVLSNEDAQAMADAMAIADVLDAQDKEKDGLAQSSEPEKGLGEPV